VGRDDKGLGSTASPLRWTASHSRSLAHRELSRVAAITAASPRPLLRHREQGAGLFWVEGDACEQACMYATRCAGKSGPVILLQNVPQEDFEALVLREFGMLHEDNVGALWQRRPQL